VTTVTSGNTENAILVSFFFILFNFIYIYMLRTKYLSIITGGLLRHTHGYLNIASRYVYAVVQF